MPTLDADSDTDDDNRTCYDSESDSDTDDDIDAGSDQTRTLLWRHVTFFIATNPGLEQPNILFATVTLVSYQRRRQSPSRVSSNPSEALLA